MARRMLQSASLRFALGALCSIPLGACNGVLGDPDAHVEDGGVDDGYVAPQDDPGRVTIHRLNNVEYDNTVRDLLGTTQRPAVNFPTDPHTYGFDNIADALTLSPSHFELHERAVEAMIDEALLGGGVGAVVNKVEGEVAGGSVGVATANAWNLYSNGTVEMTQAVETAGTYRVRARVWQDEAGSEAARSTLNVDGQVFGPFDVTATTSATAQILEQEVELTAGPAVVSVSFDNDSNTDGDRNLYVDYIEVEGPLGLNGEPSSAREKILSCDFVDQGEPCVRQILGDFAERAWRRPVADTEVDALYTLVDLADQQGDSVEIGIKLALRATLTSANFLYRPELDEDPGSVTPHKLNSWEMASRLSYFLWSSMPDDTLFDLARGDRLQDDAEIDAQIDRMLADPKALAMVENFAGQWLFTRAIASHEVNSTMFPDFDQELRDAMAEEANRYFMEFLRDDTLPLEKLVESDFTFLNDRLAAHYGLPAPGSAELVRVALDGEQRGGVLRQGGLLTATSNPDRTSPVKRGKWVMSNLLCEEPPPPPDAVTVFEQGDLANLTGKELLEKHRENPTCATCHVLFDPIGVGFENYDAVGVWRTTDKGKPIDPTEATPDYAFENPKQLAGLIASDSRFATCAAEKMVIYGTGRGPNTADSYHVGEIEKAFVASGRNLKTLIKLVVKSKPFRERRGEKGDL